MSAVVVTVEESRYNRQCRQEGVNVTQSGYPAFSDNAIFLRSPRFHMIPRHGLPEKLLLLIVLHITASQNIVPVHYS